MGSKPKASPQLDAYAVPLRDYLFRAEREYLREVLRRHRASMKRTAGHAAIDAATLHRKLKRHGLHRDEYRRLPRALL